MLAENLFGRAMRGLIAIERDLMRQSPLAPERPSEVRLGRGDVSLGAKQNIDGLSLFVDGTIEIGPATLDFDVGFVDAPRLAHRASKAVPALFEFRSIALLIVVCASESPRSAIISTRSRKLSLYRRYQRTQSTMISLSKWRPLKRSSTFNMLGHRRRYVSRRCALVDEHQFQRIEIELNIEPPPRLFKDVGKVLFARVRRLFLNVM